MQIILVAMVGNIRHDKYVSWVMVTTLSYQCSSRVSWKLSCTVPRGLPSSNGGRLLDFSDHVNISKALGASCYFAKPYHSWERGLNEHTNGLVRQYLPKGTNLREVSDATVQAIADKLNHRPRKSLGYQTPMEVFMVRTQEASGITIRDG